MKHKKTKNNETILPISTFLAIMGPFFTAVSIFYVLTVSCSYSNEERNMWFAIEGAILFVIVLLTFILIGVKKNKQLSEQEAFKFSQACINCSETIMDDWFHNSGLLYLDELLKYEEKLATNNNPKDCKVFIYTSELLSEENVTPIVKKNIETGIQYVMLFFANNCEKEEFERIKTIYGETNLVDLSKREVLRQVLMVDWHLQ